jgi:hypothetical protein
MSSKPSYIGVLNAIANAERRGHELLSTWAANTSDAEIRNTLNVVAIREAEHSWAFEKRLCELGFGLQPRDDAKHAERMACVRSNASDAEKFVFLGLNREAPTDEEDQLLKLLADRTIDPQTGALLGRFICEERDSGRRLLEACARAHQLAGKPVADRDAVLEQLSAQIAKLNERLETLSKQSALRAVS